MLRLGRLPIFTLIINVVLFYGWIFIFRENEWIKSLGTSVLQTIGVIFSLVWLFKAYWSIKDKRRYFWLLLSIGVAFYLISNLIWINHQVVRRVTSSTDFSSLMWLISYAFFLIALIYKTKEISTTVSNKPYIFNIFIFMITATAISTHYLIKPIIAASHNSLLVIITTMTYPIIDLSILFVTTILYYLIHYSKEKDLMLFIVIGFFLQVITDSVYAYLLAAGNYYIGSIVDLLWLIAILLIGFAGLYAKGHKEEPKLEIKDPFERKETIFPYISVIVLMLFVIYSYHWNFNALSLGLLVVFLTVIGRQLIIMKKNNRLMSQYRYLAYHDTLTGLDNRASFKNTLDDIMKNNNSRVALLLIDLDRFKVVNDTLGHYIGDYILTKTSERLRQALGTDTPIFRLGGDEFVIILGQATENKCSIVAEKILKRFQNPFLVREYEIIVTPSIGISIFPEGGYNGEELLRNADAAMYLAKESGKNRYRFYNTDLNKTMVRKMKIENELRRAIEREQLSLFYQPKVDLYTRKIIGMEALLRWKHPELGWVSPVEFIPIAEETGQIITIGEWVLKTACKQNKAWQDKGLRHLCLSVNVSAIQFQKSGFLMSVRKALQEARLNPQFLEIEITESIMQNTRESTEVLHSLRKMGVKASIDDFGTGYSSLNILQQLPIDTIKIDKSFINGIENRKQQAMVKSIIALGLNLNLNIVAEGIENEHQMKVLMDNKCIIGQGYLFSKPVEAKEFEKRFLVNDDIPKEDSLSS